VRLVVTSGGSAQTADDLTAEVVGRSRREMVSTSDGEEDRRDVERFAAG